MNTMITEIRDTGTQRRDNRMTINLRRKADIGIFLFFVLSLLFVSCSKTPDAKFYVEIDKAKVGAEVFFINASENADSYKWDFGDGSYSSSQNPVHIYKTVGTYSVTLTAFTKNRKESSTMMLLKVVEPTLLVIEVLEYYDVYPVGNASVILYSTLNDWDNQRNAIVEGFTDNSGIVVFGDLSPKVHYVDVWEQYHDNYQLREEDLSFIAAEVLHEKVQWFVAWVDRYFPEMGGESRTVIKKIEKREPGRTYKGSSYTGEIDYEALLKKSVVRK